ncbi:MAG: TIR domain-containing protein [Sphingomicrobium sp.]
MSDVFVSYKAEDRRRVKPLVDALEAEGFSVWWDEQIGGGATWRHAIEAELNSAKCVIVTWSKRSVGEEGTFVQDEATRAQQRHVYVPVLIDKVHLPLGFGETQALPLVGWKGDRGDARFQAILASVRRITGGKARRPASAPTVGSRTHVDRRAVLAGGAVATVAVVGIGGWTFLKPSSASAASDSIAVLPFANLSGDPAQAYFSDGIAEEIRNALARLAGIKVVGRTSSEAVRNDDAQTVAKKLEVASILTGSVRQSPSTIRVSAELIDGKTGMDRWSQDYDRSPGDSIKIQSDIAENVARSLRATLAGSGSHAVQNGGTSNVQAQNLVLEAGAALREPTGPSTLRAIQLLQNAVALDPNYSDAYAELAAAQLLYGNGFASDLADLAKYRAAAFKSATTAVRIAPNYGRAHLSLAYAYQSSLSISKARSEYERAVQLAPGDSLVLRNYSSFVSRTGDPQKDFDISKRVIELDPLNPLSYENYAGALYDHRRYADALRFAEATRRKSLDLFDAPILLGDCYRMLGDIPKAKQQYALSRADSWAVMLGKALLSIRAGDKAGGIAGLKAMQDRYHDNASYQYAQIYAQLGDRENAIAALKRAYEIRDGGLLSIKIDPMLDPVRSDPRFSVILQKMDFPA